MTEREVCSSKSFLSDHCLALFFCYHKDNFCTSAMKFSTAALFKIIHWDMSTCPFPSWIARFTMFMWWLLTSSMSKNAWKENGCEFYSMHWRKFSERHPIERKTTLFVSSLWIAIFASESNAVRMRKLTDETYIRPHTMTGRADETNNARTLLQPKWINQSNRRCYEKAPISFLKSLWLSSCVWRLTRFILARYFLSTLSLTRREMRPTTYDASRRFSFFATPRIVVDASSRFSFIATSRIVIDASRSRLRIHQTWSATM